MSTGEGDHTEIPLTKIDKDGHKYSNSNSQHTQKASLSHPKEFLTTATA
jgi:hypothetical protein